MNIWQIAPGETGRDYSSLFIEHDIMFLGTSKDRGSVILNEESYLSTPNDEYNQALNFAKKPQPGDRVIMRYSKKVVAVGQIPFDSENQYSYNTMFKCVNGWNLPHTRRVIWTKNEITEKLENVFINIKQKAAFSGVHEKEIVNEVLAINDSNFKRKLNNLPSINTKNYTYDEIGQELFSKGISNKNIDDIITALKQADRLLNWYLTDEENYKSRPSEHEIISHIIMPLLLGFGWSHQQVAIEWHRIDAALFIKTPSTDENCYIIIEAKNLGTPLGETYWQAHKYLNSRQLINVKYAVITDGANIYVYDAPQLKNSSNAIDPIGFINIHNLQKEYLLPKGTDLISTLEMLKP